jgi:hypothetical protein
VKRWCGVVGLLLVALGSGCGKTRAEDVMDVPDTRPPPQGGSAPVEPPEPPPPPQSRCDEPSPGPQPLRALDAGSVNRTIRQLLPEAELVAAPWLPEDDDYQYGPLGGQALSFTVAELHALVHDVALRLSEDEAAIASVSGCDPLVDEESACQTQFLDQFLSRAYRRPVTDDERDEMSAVFADGRKLGGNFASGVRAVVEVALQNPDFLYLVTQGSGESTGGAVALTGYETAARLAYFLTDSPPDAELRAEAERGPLDAAAVEAHARRLLGSAASRARVRRFYQGILGLNGQSEAAELGYTSELVAFAREETLRFVEDVTFDGAGTLRALFTEPSTWVNQPLAELYGLSGVVGPAFQKVSLDPGRRRGMLTQAAFLRAHSSRNYTNPVRRGMGVVMPFLCLDIPTPPPGVINVPPEPMPNATRRQQLELETREAVCVTCHREIDPIGFAFEHYDSVGRWRDTEGGLPIDSSGELYHTDAQGPFADALELVQRLADSNDVRDCFARRWLEQAYGRAQEPSDACAVDQVSQVFSETDGNLVELLVALAKSDNFRYRLESELAP